MCQESGQPIAELRDAVISPAGTTACGILAMQKAGFKGIAATAVIEAARRSAELGDPVSLALLGRMDYPDSGIFRERAERLFRSLKRAHGSFRLYHPELVFGYEKDALRLEPEEAVSAFLLHAVDVWRKTGHVKISMPEEE